LNLEEFKTWEEQWQQLVLAAREKRVRPGLDDKILASWNGLMLNGLVDAYRVFDEPSFLDLALKNALFIEQKLLNKGRLWHSYKKGDARIEGYLEDYASVIQSFSNLYQATFEERWLQLAQVLMKTSLEAFWDDKESLFFFTSSKAEPLIARKKEIFDNVIPSSNSMMAYNLLILGHLLANEEWVGLGEKMVYNVQHLLAREPYYLANWASVSYLLHKPVREVAITGPTALAFRKELDTRHLTNAVIVGTTSKSDLELLAGRGPIQGQTAIYVCENKTCQLPVTKMADALALLK